MYSEEAGRIPWLCVLFKDADVYAGDKVLTSGVGSLYPAGLLIGEVVEVYVPKPGLVKECYVKPATDFDHLEEVLVMIK